MYKPAFFVSAAALVLALAGLGYYAAFAPRGCGGDYCVDVWVQTDAGRPTIHVSVKELHKPHGGNEVIAWNVVAPSLGQYKFPDDGIKFNPDGAAKFPCEAPGSGGNRFKCKDVRGDIGKYKYTVKLVGIPQPDPLPVNPLDPLDPWVVND